ncbi:MAG: hypothetical protein AUJ12_01245 [Alphaproteobacteria bacterium CG1_02_46_17]|nr:MAG: hypothetical protein AUJ12_01245 [Alphaproteobacteria bacterium CG1_02_46_17]
MTTQTLKQFVDLNFDPIPVHLNSASEFQDAVDLIDTVRASLTEEQKVYLLPKTVDFMTKMHRAGNVILGLRNIQGQLISLTIVRKMEHWTDIPNFEGLPFIEFIYNQAPCLLQSVCTHPDYRSMGLADRLLKMAEDWCQTKERNRLVARVVVGNKGSLSAFARNDYDTLSSGIDKEDGYKFVYVGKSVSPRPYLVVTEQDAENHAPTL